MRDCWSPHESIWARFPHFQQIDEIRNCAFCPEGPSAFQLCRCAMRLLPHPRINQFKARIHSIEWKPYPSSVAMSDLWAFLCSKTLGLFSAQFAKISSRLEIHSRFIRMENAFFCHANECRRLPWASFCSHGHSGLIILFETASGGLSDSNPAVWKCHSLHLDQHCGLLPPHRPFLIHQTGQPTVHGVSSLRQATLD